MYNGYNVYNVYNVYNGLYYERSYNIPYGRRAMSAIALSFLDFLLQQQQQQKETGKNKKEEEEEHDMT
jgi:hypothetical protein